MDNMLPLGSVVKINGYKRRLMIYSRFQKNLADERIYDYLGCDYPLGIVDTEGGILFNNEAIETIFYVGFQDVEELNYRSALVAILGDK